MELSGGFTKGATMKTATLTAPQQTEAATLKAASATALTALVAAQTALAAYLRTSTGATAAQRVQLSDDGTTVIVG